MKPRCSPGFILLLLLVLAGSGVAFARQWRERVRLRPDLEMAMVEAGEIKRLGRDNQRLADQQVSAAELAKLRADHAALLRLRQELDALQKNRAVR